MTTKRQPTIGSVSSGTLRSEDLIDAFEAELEYLGAELPRPCDDPAEYVSELFDALGELAPPYAYFGANEGDGADFGFWPDLESIRWDRENGTLADFDDTSDEYSGLSVNISDHGNVSIVQHNGDGTHEELWSCV